jgi:GTPase-associated protein 1, C-terminal domain/GTPase-associated protein 1, N-terminal domain type 2/GTPase-associated protein 1, middle domain
VTGSGFRSLYYTDCLPGKGLRGGAGFQFQAVSDGTGDEEMSLVQRAALYEAPASWMREQRPVGQYPPSLAHVCEDVFVTARGVYLGAEANGVREGNQFTHAIATSDPQAYGLVRPAQLWEAPWWSREPAPTTRCEPIAAGPEAGPLGVDALREWMLAQSGAEDRLLAVHSAFDRLHGPGHVRVMFVADDVVAAVSWLAGGTLLLPQARALRISFRVLATNPNYSRHDVLVLHPDWAGRFAEPRRGGEFVVFNLVTGRDSEVEPTSSARQWVPRFLRDDPYDVLDAIELAHRFALGGPAPAATQAPANGRSAMNGRAVAQASAADRRASAVVVLGDKAGTHTEELASWLLDQAVLPAEDVAEPVIEAVFAESPSTAVLRRLDMAAYRHQVGAGLATRLRGALLASEVDDIVAGRHLPQSSPLPRLTGYPDPAAAGLVESVADTITPERMDQLLRVAARFGVEPHVGRFRDGAYRFVRWWASNPREPVDPARWSCDGPMLDLLRDELTGRLAGPGAAAVREDVRRHWRPLLRPTMLDPSAPLDAVVCAASVEAGVDRRGLVRWVLDMVSRVHPHARADVAWEALFGFAAPTSEELYELLHAVPVVSERVAGFAFGVLATALRAGVTSHDLDSLTRLVRGGLRPAQPWLLELAGQDARLHEWAQLRSTGERLDTVSAAVLLARSGVLLDGLLDRRDAATALDAVKQADQRLPTVLADVLPSLWAEEPEGHRAPAGVALAVLAAAGGLLDEQTTVALNGPIERWVGRAREGDIAAVGQAIAEVDPDQAQEWLARTERVLSRPAASRHRTSAPDALPTAAEPSGSTTGRRTKRWGFGRGN